MKRNCMNIRLGKHALLSLGVLWLADTTTTLYAHQGPPPTSSQLQVQPLSSIPQLLLPPTDVQTELSKNPAAASPLRYAVAMPVQASPSAQGAWEALPNGRLWRLRVTSPGATDLNLGFTNLLIPEGALLYV